MSFDIDTNKVINDVISRAGVSAFLIADGGSGKKDFLTKLSSFYKKVYWFSPDFDDFENLILIIASKVFKDDVAKATQVKQVLYCRNKFNNDDMIVNYIVDSIANTKSDYMFAFERLELLPQDYDYSKLKRLIKRCPPNLKIVFSSEKLPNIDIMSFGDKAPILIDNKVLSEDLDQGKVEVFCSTLDSRELQFLKDFREVPCIDISFAKTIAPEADNLITKLSKYPVLLSERDPGVYRMSTRFKWYIDQNIQLTPQYEVESLALQYADYAFGHADYYRALKLYLSINNPSGVDRCIEALLIDPIHIEALCRFSRQAPCNFSDEECAKYVYLAFYKIASIFVNNNYEKTIELSRALKARVATDTMLHSYCVASELFCLYKQGKHAEVREAWDKEMLWEKGERNILYYEDALCTLFKSMIASDEPINLQRVAKFDKISQEDVYRKEVWYVKIREILSRVYAYNGNNSRAYNILKDLARDVECYTIPHNVIDMEFRVEKDVEDIESHVEKAISHAIDNDITKDVSLLYSALARTKEYVGKIDEVLPLYKKAMALDQTHNRVKYQNIAEYIVACAKYASVDRARENADIYLKYVETYAPQYTYMMQYADAYCAYLQGELETAYAHAIESVKYSKFKSKFWLVSMAMASTYLMKKRSLDNPVAFIENLFKTAKSYGMDRVIIEHYTIFAKLIEYATQNDILPEYMAIIAEELKQKEKYKRLDTKIAVNLFGTTASVLRNNEEIAWKTKKAKELFVHYVLAGDTGLDRSYIIELMWNGYQYESAINNLKTTNNIIRNTLDASGAKYQLKYINSKYILKIEDCVIDAVQCKELLDKGIEEQSIRKKAVIAERVVREFKGQVAPDMKYPNIEAIGGEIKRGKIILLIRTIKGLIRENDCVEARRYLDWLMEIDHEGDYSNIKHEIDFRMGQI